MRLSQYDVVRVVAINQAWQPDSGISGRAPSVGDIAMIVEAYDSPPGYELECVDLDGSTIWLGGFSLADMSLELVEEARAEGIESRPRIGGQCEVQTPLGTDWSPSRDMLESPPDAADCHPEQMGESLERQFFDVTMPEWYRKTAVVLRVFGAVVALLCTYRMTNDAGGPSVWPAAGMIAGFFMLVLPSLPKAYIEQRNRIRGLRDGTLTARHPRSGGHRGWLGIRLGRGRCSRR